MSRKSLYVALAGCCLLYIARRIRKRHPPLPPGPPAEPILGHLRLLPPQKQELLFHEWGKIYGDVIYLKTLLRPVIVLNSFEAANELLEKRGAIYSNRPRFVIFEMMGWIQTLTFTGYGKLFQRHRRMLHDYLNPLKIIDYQPIQSTEARILLQNLLRDDQNRDHHIQRFSTAIIMNIASGYNITSDDDPYIQIADGANYALSNAGPPGSTFVDFFPILRHFPSWFPGTYYGYFAREVKKHIDALHNVPFERVQKEMAEGKAKPSFLSHHLENLQREGEAYQITLKDIKGAAATMFCAGADTTSSMLSWFFFAMMLHPECQQKAQEELDRVVGSGRLPEFADRQLLPYVEALFQEVLRWYPSVPLGVPHVSTEDDVYKGMFIPKGSLVIANTRGMTWDDAIYKNPRDFNPSRYLPKPSGDEEPFPDPAFGFGRRACPGRHLAGASLWIAFACILTTMNVTKAVDEDGNEVTPEVDFTTGLSSHPVPFDCRVKPRSDDARELIMQTRHW